MSSPIVYTYEPGTNVWVIMSDNACASSVKAGVIVQVRVNILVTEVRLRYDIRLEQENGTTKFTEIDIFPTLAAAIDEYEIRIA